MAEYIQAVNFFPKYTLVYNNRGLAYNLKNDYDQAITDFTKAISIDPGGAVAYISSGLAKKI
jgi:tetratricopeptide (TPR) repeat protein